ncbi:MAG: acetyl-CoA carboxylase biotin carboxyl carrier protein subunit, partial [Chloroflexota bacterium]|nr:acetyl-CoA carboxylase biotin carboxyl carrier protein subunit [Chloroflexota bacterium]
CILEGDAALPCVLEGDAALPCVLEGDAALPCVLEGGHCLRKPTVRPEPCGVEEVCAPLPGLLVATTVEVEQRVESGEVVAVLESMKMNLELRAPRGGIVQALHGTPGLEVGQGEALVVIGPDE